MWRSRLQNQYGFFLTMLGAVALTSGFACSSDKSGPAAANLPSYGASSGWTFVPIGADPAPSGGYVGTGPSSGGMGGGGVSGAGHAGTSASFGAGGMPALPPLTFKCTAKVPNQPIITSFDGFMADHWQSPGNLDGGVYVYPSSLSPAAGDFLRFDGQVKDYTGMGVWLSGCIDASKFRGLRFTISGAVGASGNVQFFLITNRDKDVNVDDSVGACVPADPNDPWPSCHPPAVTLPVTAAPTTQSIPWTALKNGSPSATTNGSDIIAIEWAFDWSGSATPYAAQLTIDDLQFFNDSGAGGSPGGGGPGGGGPGDGGAGGASPTSASGGAP
jgi:hypothetical protein